MRGARRSVLGAAAMSATMLVAAGEAASPAEGETLPADVADGSEAEGTILPIEATIVPLDSGTRQIESTEQVTISLEADVFFEFDEHDLLPEALDMLADVVDQLEEAAVDEVLIGGHTDSIGSHGYNQGLSERRAESVEAFLAERLDGVSFTTRGFSFEEPIAPNETEDGEDYPEGRALNRRVEVRYEP